MGVAVPSPTTCAKMLIAPEDIDRWLTDKPVKLLDNDGALVRHLSPSEVLDLAHKRAIFGRSRGDQLAHVVTNGVNEQEVTNILIEYRQKSPGVTSEASKTVVREQIATAAGTFTVFRHIRNQWFSTKSKERFK